MIVGKRRGMASEALAILGITLFVVAVILIAIGTKLYGGPNGFINTLKNLIPNFGDVKVPRDTALVGVNFQTEDLRYYDGTKWQIIDTVKEPKLNLGSSEFETHSLKDEFYNFYTGERRPATFLAEVNNWRYLETLKIDGGLNGWDDVEILDKPKSSFDGPITRLQLDTNQNIAFLEGDFLLPPVALEVYSVGVKQHVRDWVNQIFAGQQCEKFLSLTVNGQIKKYVVKRINPYIYVELDKPLAEGVEDKWANTNCFASSYIPAKVPVANSYGLRVFSTYDPGFFSRSLSSLGDFWGPVSGNSLEKKWYKNSYVAAFSSDEEKSLYLGLLNLFNEFYRKNSNFKDISVYGEQLDNSGRVISGGGKKIFSVAKVDTKYEVYDLVYRALDAYNQNGIELYYYHLIEGQGIRALWLGDQSIKYVAFTRQGILLAGKSRDQMDIFGQVRDDGTIILADDVDNDEISKALADGFLTKQIVTHLNAIKGKKFSDLEKANVVTGTREAYYGL